MTDARLPGRWLTAVLFEDLSDPTWRVLTGALMFCAEQGTDGLLETRHLKRLHPAGEMPTAYEQLVDAGIWRRVATGYEFVDWSGFIGQSTNAEVTTYRENNRRRQEKLRARRKAERAAEQSAGESAPLSSEPVTGDVTRYAVGKGSGKGSGTDVDAVTSWETAKIPDSDPDGWERLEDGSFAEPGVRAVS
jgi:hypothetical protein